VALHEGGKGGVLAKKGLKGKEPAFREKLGGGREAAFIQMSAVLGGRKGYQKEIRGGKTSTCGKS